MLAWLGSSRLCTYESLLPCFWAGCLSARRFLLRDRRLALKLRRGDSGRAALIWFMSRLRRPKCRMASKLPRCASVLGRGLEAWFWVGERGERVARTPSVSFPVRILGSDWLLPPVSLGFLGPWRDLRSASASRVGAGLRPSGVCVAASSIRILRTLRASFPLLKKEKKYCAQRMRLAHYLDNHRHHVIVLGWEILPHLSRRSRHCRTPGSCRCRQSPASASPRYR